MVDYDLIIVGGGIAGLSAAFYASRYGIKTAIIEKGVEGGEAAAYEGIDNFPLIEGFDGWALTQKMADRVKDMGGRIIENEALEVREKDGLKLIICRAGEEYLSKAVIIASGGVLKRLGVKGETRLARKGIHSCAPCAGPFYEGKTVAVVGGGSTALTSVIYLSKIARKITMIVRGESFRGDNILVEELDKKGDIEILHKHIVEEIKGTDHVNELIIRDLETDGLKTLKVDGVFINIGRHPNTALVDVDKDDKGFIKVDMNMHSSESGIFACGKAIRENAIIISSAGEGAVAGLSAVKYINGLRE